METVGDQRAEPIWQKARKSIGNGACVEIAKAQDLILVRDSKNPDGAALSYTEAEFSAFLDGAKNGEFDHFC